MTARIDNPGPTLAEVDVARLERALQARLPTAYRSFLLQYNGGLPTPFRIEVPTAPGSPTDVQVFFGSGREVESSDIQWNHDVFKDRLPSHMLPIACDPGGNLLCLLLAGDDEGAIVYADIEGATPAFYRVADGIVDLLEKLH